MFNLYQNPKLVIKALRRLWKTVHWYAAC